MATLSKRFQYVWYGTCDSAICSEFVFESNRQLLDGKVESISKFNLMGDGTDKYIVDTPQLATLDRMTCGTMYSIVLKPGMSVDIPNVADAGAISSGQTPYKVSFTCSQIAQPTPTPTQTQTAFVCIPDDYNFVTTVTNSAFHEYGLHNFLAFSIGDRFGLDSRQLVESGMGDSLTLRLPNSEDDHIIQLSELALNPAAAATVYLEHFGACYEGIASTTNDTVGGMYIVPMYLLGDGPAPQPTQTPVPVQTQTPVPVSSDCDPGDYDFATTIADAAFHEYGLHNFLAFSVGDMVMLDSGQLVESGMGDSLTLRLPNSTDDHIIQFSELGLNPSSGCTIYWKHLGACYSGVALTTNDTVGGMYIVNMSLVSGEPAPEPTQTPVPVQTQTPVPVQPPADCCPSSFMSVTTSGPRAGQGTMTLEHWKIILSGEATQTAVFSYKGFDDGGEFCFDPTDSPSEVTPNMFEDTQVCMLEGVVVGTVKKYYPEGSTTMYYNYNGECWSGDYGNAIYTTSSGTDQVATNLIKQ